MPQDKQYRLEQIALAVRDWRRKQPTGTQRTHESAAADGRGVCVNGVANDLAVGTAPTDGSMRSVRSQHEQPAGRAGVGYSSGSRSTHRRPLRTHECVRRRRRIGRNEFDPDEGQRFNGCMAF
ncbi:hypothetical protein Aduo_005558 [Ancylostoma duodenale]